MKSKKPLGKHTLRDRRKRARNRKFIAEYLEIHHCVDCKEDNPVVLDFDHVRGKKKSNISVMVLGGRSIKSIKEEIEKCEVRCSNCHRIKTAKNKEWMKK